MGIQYVNFVIKMVCFDVVSIIINAAEVLSSHAHWISQIGLIYFFSPTSSNLHTKFQNCFAPPSVLAAQSTHMVLYFKIKACQRKPRRW